MTRLAYDHPDSLPVIRSEVGGVNVTVEHSGPRPTAVRCMSRVNPGRQSIVDLTKPVDDLVKSGRLRDLLHWYLAGDTLSSMGVDQ